MSKRKKNRKSKSGQNNQPMAEDLKKDGRHSGHQQDDKTETQEPVDLNEGLKEQIASYWDEENAPKYEGYREEDIKAAEARAKGTRKKPTAKTVLKLILIIIMIFILTVAGVIFAMEQIGKKALLNDNAANTEITTVDGAEMDDGGKKVVYNGEEYCYNENITTLLVMGIDREEFNDSGKYAQGGSADSLFMVAIDTEKGSTTMIPISRYTMVNIDEYKEDGTYWRQNEIQVALAYAYGDGREVSSENVTTAISRLMYGMPISGYVTIEMSGISVLNDAIGGVQVEVIEDLSNQDSELTVGNTVTLMGQQAEIYVRSRKSEGYDLEVDNNAPRMERQVQYMNAFLTSTLSQTRSNPTLPLSLYQLADDYMITDVTASEVTYLATLMAQHGLDNTIVSIPGTAEKGEYTEVYVDNDALYEIVLDVFYDKIG